MSLIGGEVCAETNSLKFLKSSTDKDTFDIQIEKLWPLNIEPQKEIDQAKWKAISFVGMRNDTMLIISNTSKLFYNDMYEFFSKIEFFEMFPIAQISFSVDIEGLVDTAPNNVYVETNYGDCRDSLVFVGEDPHYLLEGGVLYTNQLFTLNKRCKIGTPIADFFDFLGVNNLGINVPQHWCDGVGCLIIDQNAVETTSPPLQYQTTNAYIEQVIIKILNGRIYSIKFGIDRNNKYPYHDFFEYPRFPFNKEHLLSEPDFDKYYKSIFGDSYESSVSTH